MVHTRRSVIGFGLTLPFMLGWGKAQPVPAASRAAKLIAAARQQIGVTLQYDPAYTRLAFPGGDVPRSKGVCTDVVIRAYRDSLGVDLQALVNADMRAAFGAYPKRWGLKRPDANIDHRRVANLDVFLTRKGARLPIPARLADWKPGDLVSSLVGGRLPHTGIVSDRRAPAATPCSFITLAMARAKRMCWAIILSSGGFAGWFERGFHGLVTIFG